MNNSELGYTDRQQYWLLHENHKPFLVEDPIGYNEDSIELAKVKNYDGVTIVQSGTYRFFGSAKKHILFIDSLYDIKARLKLQKRIKHPQTDDWVIDHEGYLEFKGLSEKQDEVSLKYSVSGLAKILRSRQSQKFEIERTSTISSETITPLEINKMALEGRKIFLKSKLTTEDKDRTNTAFRMNFTDGNNRTGALAIPCTVISKSDTHIHDVHRDVFTTKPDSGTDADGISTSFMFYSNNDREKTLKLKFHVSCLMNEVKIDDLKNEFLKVTLAIYTGLDHQLVERKDMYAVPNINNVDGQTMDVTFETEVILQVEESLSFQFYGGGEFGRAAYQVPNLLPPFIPPFYVIPADDGDLSLDFLELHSTIYVDENSSFPATQANVTFPLPTANKMMEVLTGRKNIVLSNVLGRIEDGYEVDGEFSHLGTTTGMWLRGFTSEDERYKPFTSNWTEWWKSYSACCGLGMGIVTIGNKEYVIIEKKEFFYNKTIGIRLGEFDENGIFQHHQVSNVERKRLHRKYYSGIKVGSTKGGEYEEAMGLDEYNTKSEYFTNIDVVVNLYVQEFKYRRDPYGGEFARRLQKLNFPTTDSRYDSDIFLKDLKRGPAEVYEERTWVDDCDEQPTGVYDPNSATNLRLTQTQIIKRHGWVIGSGLIKYPNDFIVFGSSVANSNLEMKINGTVYNEDGNIKNNSLKKARYIPQEIKFEYPVSYELMEKFKSNIKIDGIDVPIRFCLIEYMNEKKEIETAFVDNLNPKGIGKWVATVFNNK